jgi:ribonuclease HII
MCQNGAMPDWRIEAGHGGLVAGVDEAGRGPLAGPVVAAAVVFTRAPAPALAERLDDSKRLSPAERETAALLLREAALTGALAFALGAASAREIGARNILAATHLAMRRAVARLPLTPSLVLIDGNRAPPLDLPTRCLIGGDAKSLSIAAASILAKTVRDRAMRALCPRWPAYGFARHMGYPTAAHRAALAEHGACPHHRRGFAPVEAALDGRIRA